MSPLSVPYTQRWQAETVVSMFKRNLGSAAVPYYGTRLYRRDRSVVGPTHNNATDDGSGTALEASSRKARWYTPSGPAPSGSKLPIPVTQFVSLMPSASLSVQPLFGSINVLRSIATVPMFQRTARWPTKVPVMVYFCAKPTDKPAALM